MNTDKEYYRRTLPHWQPPGATLFVTTRLAGSLPGSVIRQMKNQHLSSIEKNSDISDVDGQRNQQTFFKSSSFSRWDEALESANTGPFWLRQPQIAGIVESALHYRYGKEFDLYAFCIMPNHLHIVFRPLEQNSEPIPLERIMHSLKRYTAREANKTLARQGSFWQAENYDHVIRNLEEMEKVILYVVYNPVKAGLVKDWEDWQWTYCCEEYLSVVVPDDER